MKVGPFNDTTKEMIGWVHICGEMAKANEEMGQLSMKTLQKYQILGVMLTERFNQIDLNPKSEN